MAEVFRDKAGNPLEEGLYNLSIIDWPMTFRNYAYVPQGDFKRREAVFQDYKGRHYHLSKPQVSALATRTTLEDLKNYISAAKSLMREIQKEFLQIMPVAQTSAKCTTDQEENNAIFDELFGPSI